ncbi:MAG: lipopolysaccharide heptosyltransferase II, partial [Phycisphaerae bacterium]
RGVDPSATPVSDLRNRSFDRILLIKPSSLGDVIHALPVLHGLRVRYPKARIDWLIASPLAPLLAAVPELDEAVPFDRRRFGRLATDPVVVREFVGFVRRLRARRYELAVDLQGLFRTGFLSWASGAGVRVGLGSAREGASVFYTHRLAVGDPESHAVDRNYLVAGLLGFEELPVTFNLGIGDRARSDAAELLDARDTNAAKRLVLVAPGARWETKLWSPRRFAETIDRLHAGGTARCVLIGGAHDTAVCDRVAATCRRPPGNLAGRTDLQQLPAVIEKADLVLCHDSAALHLAVALDRPVVCVIGPTNPRRTGPYRRPGDVVRLSLDCAPCYLRKLTACPHHHRCMADLDADRVIEAAERALNHHPAPPH